MVSSEFKSKLNRQIRDIPKSATSARKVLDRLRPLLNKYHGGMPVGFLAAIASFESGGKMSSRGDSSLGEVGIFQITSSFPGKVGLPAASRFEEEVNVFLGCLEYQMMAVEMWKANPRISRGTVDNWKLARLAFAIGAGGTRTLLARSGANSYGELTDYVNRTGGTSLGKQSASKVWFRVNIINVLWDIGKLVQAPLFVGMPQQVPAPPGRSYKLPSSVSPYLPNPLQGALIALTMGLAAILLA